MTDLAPIGTMTPRLVTTLQGNPGRVMQSFTRAPWDGTYFEAQVEDEASSDMRVSRCDTSGRVLDYAVLEGAGHGSSITAEYADGKVWIWLFWAVDPATGAQSSPVRWAYQGTTSGATVRLVDAEAVPDPDTAQPGHTWGQFAIDQAADRIATYFRSGNTERFTLWKLSEYKAGTGTALNRVTVTKPSNASFQGFTTSDTHAYIARGGSQVGDVPPTLYELAWSAGAITGTKDVSGLVLGAGGIAPGDHNEAEGVCLWRNQAGTPTLLFGVVTGPAQQREGRIYSMTAPVDGTATKTLLLDVENVAGTPMTNAVVDVSYDRTVRHTDGGMTPASAAQHVKLSEATTVQVFASDHATLTDDCYGFAMHVRASWDDPAQPGRRQSGAWTAQVSAADPDVVALSQVIIAEGAVPPGQVIRAKGDKGDPGSDADATAATVAAQQAAANAAAAAALVGAPADTAISTAVNGTGTQTKAAVQTVSGLVAQNTNPATDWTTVCAVTGYNGWVQGLTYFNGYFWWGTNGTQLLQVNPANGAIVNTYVSPSHAASGGVRRSRGTLIFSSGGNDPAEVWEIDPTDGSKIQSWDFSTLDTGIGALVAWDDTADTDDWFYVCTSISSNWAFKMWRIQLHDDGTYSTPTLVFDCTPTGLGITQGMECANGCVYLLTDAGSPYVRSTVYRLDPTPDKTVVKIGRTWTLSHPTQFNCETEGLTFYNGGMVVGVQVDGSIRTAPIAPKTLYADTLQVTTLATTGASQAGSFYTSDQVLFAATGHTATPVRLGKYGTTWPTAAIWSDVVGAKWAGITGGYSLTFAKEVNTADNYVKAVTFDSDAVTSGPAGMTVWVGVSPVAALRVRSGGITLPQNGSSITLTTTSGTPFVVSADTLAGMGALPSVSWSGDQLSVTGSNGTQTSGHLMGATGPAGVSSIDPSSTQLQGTGSPVGVVTPSASGIHYTDLGVTNGARLWISTGTTSSAWAPIIGDTGWREVSVPWQSTRVSPVWLTAPTSGSSTQYGVVRRVNQTVTFSFLWTIQTGDAIVGNNRAGNPMYIVDIPTGFRPLTTKYTTVQGHGSVGNNTAMFRNNQNQTSLSFNCDSSATATYAVGNQIGGQATWVTNDAWPTSLPGTAVS